MISIIIIVLLIFQALMSTLLSRKIFSPLNLFTFGLNFYFILPVLYGVNSQKFDIPQFSGWINTFDSLSDSDVYFILFFTFICYVSFLLPCVYFYFTQPKRKYFKQVNLSFFYLFIAIFSFFIWYLGRNSFFSGYKSGYDSSVLGLFATLNVLLIFFFISSSRFSKAYLCLLVINSVLMLSMGGRMYVVLAIIALVIHKQEHDGLRIKYLMYLILAVIAMVLIGMWRLDGVKLDIFLYILLAEPIFTSYSMLSFVQSNEMPLFGIPYNFVNSFLMFLPSVIIDKSQFIVRIEGFDFISPVGAISFLVSLIGNFGIIGSLIFLLLLSYIVNKAFSSSNNLAFIFSCIAMAVLPFMLFRDPFGVSMKIMFMSGFIIPAMALLVHSILPKVKY